MKKKKEEGKGKKRKKKKKKKKRAYSFIRLGHGGTVDYSEKDSPEANPILGSVFSHQKRSQLRSLANCRPNRHAKVGPTTEPARCSERPPLYRSTSLMSLTTNSQQRIVRHFLRLTTGGQRCPNIRIWDEKLNHLSVPSSAKNISDLAFRLIFHRFSPFNCCLSVIL